MLGFSLQLRLIWQVTEMKSPANNNKDVSGNNLAWSLDILK